MELQINKIEKKSDMTSTSTETGALHMDIKLLVFWIAADA